MLGCSKKFLINACTTRMHFQILRYKESVNFFRKTLHRRCLAGFSLRLREGLLQKYFDITANCPTNQRMSALFHAKIAMFYNILLKKVCIFQTMVSSDNDFSILFSDLVRHKVSVYFKVLYSAKTQLPKDFNFDKDRIFVVIVFLGSFLVCGSSFMSILRSVPEMKKVSCIGAQTRKPTIEEIINKNVFTKL